MKTNTEIATQIIKAIQSGDATINVLEYAETILDAWRIEIEGRNTITAQSLCPCCRQPFKIEYLSTGKFSAWCGGSKPCTSYLANNGAIADTPQESVARLSEILERKKDWK